MEVHRILQLQINPIGQVYPLIRQQDHYPEPQLTMNWDDLKISVFQLWI